MPFAQTMTEVSKELANHEVYEIYVRTIYGHQDALYTLIKLADEENALAQAYISMCQNKDYSKGLVTKEEATEYGRLSLDWVQMEADLWNPYAQSNLAMRHKYGNGVSKDLEEAKRLWECSASQHLPIAFYNLGELYYNGKGVTKCMVTAKKYYTQAATYKFAWAEHRLGEIYSRSNNSGEHILLGFLFTMKAAKAGIAPAQYNLGIRYLNGYDLPKDSVRGAEWIKKAAEQGYAGPSIK